MADWEVDHEEPVAPPKTKQDAPKWEVSHETPVQMSFGRQLLGNAELGGSAIASIPHAVAHAGADLINRVTGDDSGKTPWVDSHIPSVGPGAAGRELSTALGSDLTDTIDKAGLGGAATAAVGAANNAGSKIQNEPSLQGDLVRSGLGVMSDFGQLANVGAAGADAVSSVRRSVQSGLDAAGMGTDWRAAGLRSGGGHPIARQIAGESGPQALIGHNAQVGGTVAASEAGHPQGAPMSQTSMAEASQEPSAVYNRIATTLPEGQLSAGAQARLASAGQPGGTLKPSLQVQAQIDATKQQLLAARTGQQHVENLRSLRQQGFANAASEVPAEQELGKAQLDMGGAVEQHIEDTLPENGPVSMEQFKAARQQLAKNWAVRSALQGGDSQFPGIVDLRKLGRIQENSPGQLTGGLKMLADFANGPGRDVVGVPEQYNPPSVAQDAAGIFNVHRPVQSTVQGLGGGSAARTLLTGNTRAAIEKAQSMFPGRAPGSFAPLPSAQLPGGRIVRPGDMGPLGGASTEPGANPNPAAPAPMGDLAGVMSQGVGEGRPAGLTSGPMAGPPSNGPVPYRPSPEFFGAQPVQGGAPPLAPRFADDYGNEVNPNQDAGTPPTLGDRFARGDQPPDRPASVLAGRPTVPDPNAEPSMQDLLAELSDYAKVKSQGVPEGTAAKAGPRSGPSKPWLVGGDQPPPPENIDALMEALEGDHDSRFSNNASGQTDVSQEFANWQADRQAQGITRHRYDPSTDEMVPMHSTSARDPASVQGRPVFDRDAKGNYIPVDRGGMPLSAINGIIARMKGLGDRFASQ